MDKNHKRWIRRIVQNGDKKAANALVSFYYDEIYGFIYKRLNNEDTAMDITQDILVTMLRSIKHFDEKKSSFRTWLYVITKRQLANYFASKNYKADQLYNLDDVTLNQLASMYINAQQVSELSEIKAFIDTLDHKSREIFLLKVFDQYTFAKIAEITNVPESTVKTTFYATQKRVREEFTWNR